jgi:fumarylacetoacetase
MIDKQLITWVEVPANSDFSIYNLPFGIFTHAGSHKRVGVAIGDQVLDMTVFHKHGYLDALKIDATIFENEFLNDFIGLGKEKTNLVREKIQAELCNQASTLKNDQTALLAQDAVVMHMPVKIGDYTDFYSSIEHATNVGKMFRDPENALLPNWKHIPVGYHGRASSIVLSGTDIYRPKGQTKPNDGPPVFGPTQRFDFELEMAFIVGKDTALGESIPTKKANDYIFGMVIFNDWSARDIQKWEYVPLGPFLAKNFASSISPWVVTMEALEPFRTEGPQQEPAVLPYLEYEGKQNYDINLEVGITPENSEEQVVCHSNFKYMYWNMAQQLAHHTVNGCNVKVGDMMASGTISGKDETAFGSMLELAWAGTKPVPMKDGTERKFLLDGDTVTMRAFSEKDGIKVGFGEVSGKILPAT